MTTATQKRTWRCTDCSFQFRDRFDQTFCPNCVNGMLFPLPGDRPMNNKPIPYDRESEQHDPELSFDSRARIEQLAVERIANDGPTLGDKTFDFLVNLALGLALGTVIVTAGAAFALWILGIDLPE